MTQPHGYERVVWREMESPNVTFHDWVENDTIEVAIRLLVGEFEDFSVHQSGGCCRPRTGCPRRGLGTER